MLSSTRARSLAASTCLALAASGLAIAGSAGAATADPRSVTFTVDGTFTVPAGIHVLEVSATGGAGGRSLTSTAGGLGGRATATLAVTPGEQLWVRVGGRGVDGVPTSGGAGGANGGGAAGFWISGGGGGASDVRIGADTLEARVLVAAGGGGAGFDGEGVALPGGAAGEPGTRAPYCFGYPAQPGGLTAGGEGARPASPDCSYRDQGGAGGFGVGGSGSINGANNGGGGGGAGWYGGGGGSSFASGAGGSSWADPVRASNVEFTTTTAAPSVTIRYDRLVQTVTFDDAPETAVAGTSYDVAAAGGGSGQPVTLSIGPATTAGACTLEGATVRFAHAGTCQVQGQQAGDDSHAPGEGSVEIEVVAARTTTTVQVGPDAMRAAVRVDAPSTLPATGVVRFTVDGALVGEVDLEGGLAVLRRPVPPGADRAVAATYLGSADLTGSSAALVRRDPIVTVAVASTRPPVAGWYRTPVRADFRCTPRGAELLEECPPPVVLAGDGARQSVTRTVTAVDGGRGSATVAGISIDATAPKLRVRGVRPGRTYGATSRPRLRCVASDALSGLTSCTLRQTTRRVTATKVQRRYTAVATDRAGNAVSVVGTYWVRRAKR